MPRANRWSLVATIIAALPFAACQQKAEEAAIPIPPQAEYTGPSIQRVRLTANRAAELGIQTAPIREEKISGQLRKVIPVVAVLRDDEGNTWAFKNTDAFVFIRERISIESIAGDVAILLEGPAVGTEVVTAGASELFKDEFGSNQEAFVPRENLESAQGEKATGTATLLENGNLKVVHLATGASGLTASIVVEYKPQDEEYQKILAQVGGLKPGETKSVPPLQGQSKSSR